MMFHYAQWNIIPKGKQTYVHNPLVQNRVFRWDQFPYRFDFL